MKHLIIIILALSYLALAAFQTAITHGPLIFGSLTTIAQVILDLTIAWILYQKTEDRKSEWLPGLFTAFTTMAIGDVVYGTIVNVLNLPNLRGSFLESFYNSIYLVSLVSIAFYLIKSSQCDSRKIKILSYLLTTLLGTAVAITFGKPIFTSSLPLFSIALHLICLATKCVILSFGIMSAILFHRPWRRLIASGFLIILSYSTLLEYLEIQNALQRGFPMEVFWTFGLATILYGVTQSTHDGAQDKWDCASLSAKVTLYSLALSVSVIGSWILLQYVWSLRFPSLPKIGLATSWIILLLVCLGAFSHFMRSLLVNPMVELTEALRSTHKTKVALKRDSLIFGRFTELASLSHEILLNFEELHQEKERSERLSQLASHMSHDIRSPLTALRMLTSQTEGLAETTRQMIIQIASRINLIAENLLIEHRQTQKITDESCMIYGIAETIISEKRILLPQSHIHIDLSVSDAAYTCWVKLRDETAGRILSNLLNNAIEAFELIPQLANPRISVVVSRGEQHNLRLSIQDNAGGIPVHIEKAIHAGASITDKAKGSGLGLSQARSALDLLGGQLQVITQLGFGTVINVMIPMARPPVWFAQSIDIDPSKPVLVLDDDQSIHSIWKRRLWGRVELLHCFSVEEAKQALSKCPTGSTILGDFYLRGSAETGLAFLKGVPRTFKRYLVTSHFNDENIHRGIQEIGSRLLPKLLAPFVTIILKEHPKGSTALDMVLIDDDPLIRTSWEFNAKQQGIAIACIKTPDELPSAQITFDTPVYIDKVLSGSLDGVKVAEELFNKGFRNLYLATGHDIDWHDLSNPSFLNGVIGKDFPGSMHLPNSKDATTA